MNCTEVLGSLSDYLDDDLDEEAADEIGLHLGACPSCQAFVNTLQRTVELCRDITVPPLPQEDKAAIAEAIRAARRSPGKGDGKS